MGLCPLPRYKLYWSSELRVPAVADVFTRNKFLDIKKYLHFVDNNHIITEREDPNYNRFAKIQPFLNELQLACSCIEPEEIHSVDEQMIPFKGRSALEQYMPMKPHKWGFKVFARCGISGITYDFFFYDGKTPLVKESLGLQPADFVLKLCEGLPTNLNYKIYFDNFFNFLELQIQLKDYGIWSSGTIRANRLWGCDKVLKDEKSLKKEGRGSYDYQVEKGSGVTVIRWFDNKIVQLTSTITGVNPVKQVKRWDRKEKKYIQVNCPAIVVDYNQHMGGVDLFDMLMSLYRLDHKSKKWYKGHSRSDHSVIRHHHLRFW